MKKLLLASVIMVASATALAQATISGSISVGVMDTGLSATTKPAVTSLGGGANVINFNTTETLSRGLTAGFNGQIRFNAASGDVASSGVGNALMHDAHVYLSSGMGTVRLGKIAEASNCAFDPWGCTGGAGLIAGAAGTVSGLIAAGTQASSVSYTTPVIGGFSVGYQTTLTTGKTATDAERRVWNANFVHGPVALQVLRSENGANTAADNVATVTAPTGLSAKGGSGTGYAASYDFGVAKVSAFNSVTKSATATTADILGVGVSVPMNKEVTLLGGWSKNKSLAGDLDNKLALGVNYALSKRTSLGADVFKQDAVGGNTGWVTRVRHTF